jgi:uncharacterized protein CbrC (UPF0167 family)
MRSFTYFADPLHFAHLAAPGTPCDFCRRRELAFDGGGFYGERDVQAICVDCLRSGRLRDVGASTNEVTVTNLAQRLGSEQRARDVKLEIECCTPALPTWQDREWPFFDGEFPCFIKIASQPDFVDKDDLYRSIPEHYRFGRDADEFWSLLPATRITSLADGNYDTSFYLFRLTTGKLCTWDCN